MINWLVFESYLWYLAAGLTCLASTVNVIIVFFARNEIKPQITRKFILYSFALAFWSLNVLIFSMVRSESIAYFCSQLLHLGAIFIPVFLLDFVLTFFSVRNKRNQTELIVVYLLSVAFALTLIFKPHLFVLDVVHKRNFPFFLRPGPLYIWWMVLFFYIVLSAHIKVLLSYFKAKDEDKKRLAFFVFPSLFAYISCIAYFFPVYDIFIFPYPWGCFGSMTLSSIIAYGIIRHNLLGIEIIVKKTLVFAGLFAFTYAIFTVVTILGQDILRANYGWNEWIALIPTVMVITFALRPLENFLTNATEKYLFQKKYDYRQLLKTFTNEVLTVLDIQQLPEQTISGLIKILKLESASIFLHDKEKKVYSLAAMVGAKKRFELGEVDTLVLYLKASGQFILKDKIADKFEGENSLKETFRALNAQICFPISMHDDLIGILCLGMKKSGEDYTQEDIDILQTLARTEAIAIANAQLFDELSKTQAEAAQREKMAVIGTLAAGINHEICNPLGIVRGQCEMFLLNLRDGFYKEKSQEEMCQIAADIMNKVIKETDRATGITKKLSGFAKPSKRSDMEEVYIEKEAEEVLGLVGHDLKLSNIDVQQDFPKDFPVILADKKQIQEVLFNIIRNAAQAIDKKQGRIVLSGFKDNGTAVVRIADNGSGIPKDKVEQIFHPFYTTKSPGKGTGLGLFIVKQVVERNQGTIAVESEVGVGTTFTLRFPTASATAMHN